MPPKKKDVVSRMLDLQNLHTDPQGSWTGQPAEPEKIPVQDADDL